MTICEGAVTFFGKKVFRPLALPHLSKNTEKGNRQKLLKVLRDPVFRTEIAHFSGNDYRDLGKVIMEV